MVWVWLVWEAVHLTLIKNFVKKHVTVFFSHNIFCWPSTLSFCHQRNIFRVKVKVGKRIKRSIFRIVDKHLNLNAHTNHTYVIRYSVFSWSIKAHIRTIGSAIVNWLIIWDIVIVLNYVNLLKRLIAINVIWDLAKTYSQMLSFESWVVTSTLWNFTISCGVYT